MKCLVVFISLFWFSVKISTLVFRAKFWVSHGKKPPGFKTLLPFKTSNLIRTISEKHVFFAPVRKLVSENDEKDQVNYDLKVG